MKNDNYYQGKDKKKIIRSIIQILVLIGVAYLIINACFNLKIYENSSLNIKNPTDQGFITISYFGVDQTGDETLIGTEQLDQHLKALKESGYVTISQQDVMDYYKNGKILPEKSLFLIFEDGRRDTAIFAQEIMERYNFKATMLTYADKFDKQDPKFLTPDDLIHLEKSTFWELGTNGYRLEYINVFDRYKNFLGRLDTLEFAGVSGYLNRNYNHYLMDYIRDEYGIPTESYDEMQTRINNDYEKMQEIYLEELNKIPSLYILMHSNTGQFATNDKVSDINEKMIREMFEMNFNREGNAYNDFDASIYDLTRLQPQSYWSTNHLLMKISNDNKQDISFVSGSIKQKDKWDTLMGESEFKDEKLLLTSLPESRGLMRLKESATYKNFDISMNLKGNKFGIQKIYLRADDNLNSAISVEINNNKLNVIEKKDQTETILTSINLDQFDGIQSQSVEQNKKDAEIEEIKTSIQYADSIEKATELTNQLNQKLQESVPSVEEGGALYEPEIDIRESGNRYIKISIYEDNLSVSIDNKLAIDQLKIKNNSNGYIFLESAWGGYGYSQRNLSDDVYDGVFEKITITTNEANLNNEKDKVLYDNCLHGNDLLYFNLIETWKSVINWFIKTL